MRWSTKSYRLHAPDFAPDAVLIDHTTTLPELTARRAERLAAQGMKYLHCPVFMGPAAARNAQGLMMAAGPRAIFENVKADLARMTGRLDYMGERADLAAVNKLLGNAMIVGLGGCDRRRPHLGQGGWRRRRGRHQVAWESRPERDGFRTRGEYGKRQLHPEFRAGHGAKGCAADARDCLAIFPWRRCPRSRREWISSSQQGMVPRMPACWASTRCVEPEFARCPPESDNVCTSHCSRADAGTASRARQ